MNNKKKYQNFSVDNQELKENSFKTPDGYFDNLEEIIIKKTKSAIPKSTGFEVDDVYFTNIEDKILKRVNTKTKVISLNNRLLRFSSIAAAACVLLFISINFFSNENEVDINSISEDDIENWYATTDNFNSADIAAVFSESDFEINYEDIILDDNSLEEYLSNSDNLLLFNETY